MIGHGEGIFEYYLLAFFKGFKGIDADPGAADVGAHRDESSILAVRRYGYFHRFLIRISLVSSLSDTV